MSEFMREIVRTIIVSWDDWEAEANQQAQQYQLPEAYDFAMQARLQIVLETVVEESAKVCEGRANCRLDSISIYNEAMKCADQIRHNLLGASK